MLRHILPYELNKFKEHLLRLDTEDRRMRFGMYTGDETIEKYVDNITLFDDVIYGCFDSDLNIIAAIHICIINTQDGHKHAELGLSVEKSQRGKGHGHALFKKAVEWGENRGVSELFTQCLAQNSFMLKIAEKEGMTKTSEDGEVFAKLKLENHIPHFHNELTEEIMSWLDYSLKFQTKILRKITNFD